MSTYTQIYVQTVFSVYNREPLLNKNWRDRLYNYIIAIINNHKHNVLAIGGTEDHIHIFFCHNQNQTIPDLMRQVKRDSSIWIKNENLIKCRFAWQEGYGAFSYSKSQADIIIEYIRNQEKHHLIKSSYDEYVQLLDAFGIEYEKKYVL